MLTIGGVNYDAKYFPADADQTTRDEQEALFGKYTPAAYLTMTILNPAAYEAFVPGQGYALTFEPYTPAAKED